MVVYLYRWKLKPGKEAQFQSAWDYVTRELKEKCGSLGSRLHRGNDGLWYGYAQWPSAEMRDSAKLNHPEMLEARFLMRGATVESFPDVRLEPILDHLA